MVMQKKKKKKKKKLDSGVQGSGKEVEEGLVYLWLIHVGVWQKPAQHCKAIILLLNLKN